MTLPDMNMKLPGRMVAPFLAIAFLFPMLTIGLVYYDFFLNNAIDRIDVESLALCGIGAILLFAGASTWSPHRPLIVALWLAGAMLVVGSVMAPLLLGRFGLPLIATGLIAAAIIVTRMRRLRQMRTGQVARPSVDIAPYIALVPALKGLGQHSLWSHYDPDTDTLAIHFGEPDAPNIATDSEMSDDRIITRYNDAGEVIGLTILHASTRAR